MATIDHKINAVLPAETRKKESRRINPLSVGSERTRQALVLSCDFDRAHISLFNDVTFPHRRGASCKIEKHLH